MSYLRKKVCMLVPGDRIRVSPARGASRMSGVPSFLPTRNVRDSIPVVVESRIRRPGVIPGSPIQLRVSRTDDETPRILTAYFSANISHMEDW
jgi:hypothetical protein